MWPLLEQGLWWAVMVLAGLFLLYVLGGGKL